MGKMPVPCYGCGGTLAVDSRAASQGLLAAGWTIEHGGTYCAACRPEAPAEGRETPAAGAIGDQAALWHAGTRSALERYRRRAPAAVAGGAGLLVVLATIILIRAADGHRAAIVPTGWLRPLIMAVLLASALMAGSLTVRRRAARWGAAVSGGALTPLEEPGAPVLLRLGPVFKWRAAALRVAEDQTVWLAGEPGLGRVLGLPPVPSFSPSGHRADGSGPGIGRRRLNSTGSYRPRRMNAAGRSAAPFAPCTSGPWRCGSRPRCLRWPGPH
jgi:hypothetical protein